METSDKVQALTDEQPTATKKCPKCGKTLPLTSFYRNRRKKDGHSVYCKVCHREGTKKNKSVKKTTTTAPQHPIFSTMHPREIIDEIRERLDYLRATGWTLEGNELLYTQIRRVKL